VSQGLAAEMAEAGGARQQARSHLWATLLLVTTPVLAADQLSKVYIRAHFKPYQAVALIPNWLDLTHTMNPGAAFSLLATTPAGLRGTFFVALSAIAIVVLVALLARRSTPLGSGIAYALILGGTIGNLIDRLERGVVTDFIYFHHNSFSYPVFNLADSAITVGVALILIFAAMSGHPRE
jgi:signal peptidase II